VVLSFRDWIGMWRRRICFPLENDRLRKGHLALGSSLSHRIDISKTSRDQPFLPRPDDLVRRYWWLFGESSSAEQGMTTVIVQLVTIRFGISIGYADRVLPRGIRGRPLAHDAVVSARRNRKPCTGLPLDVTAPAIFQAGARILLRS